MFPLLLLLLVPVHIQADFPVYHTLEGNMLHVSIPLTLPNPCVDVKTYVLPLKCPNCFEVHILEFPSKQPCIQVVVNRNVDVSIPLEYNYPAHVKIVKDRDPCRVRVNDPELEAYIKARCSPSVEFPVFGGKIIIKREENGFLVSDGNRAITIVPRILTESNHWIIGGRVLVSPNKILQDFKVEFNTITVETEENRIVYQIVGEIQGRLLGIFPIMVPIKLTVDAERGEIISKELPWWSFLVSFGRLLPL